MAHLAQMSRSRRPDQTTSDHRKFQRVVGAHGQLLRVERSFSHSQFFIQADGSRRIVQLNFQIDVLRAPTPKFPKYAPQQCRRDATPTRQRMNNQVFDEGTGPALGDTDNVLPLIDREETKITRKLVVIAKAGPPLFKCSDVASALSVADLEQAVNRRRIVSGKRPHATAGRVSRWGNRFGQVAP
jgi:hypothetical protein